MANSLFHQCIILSFKSMMLPLDADMSPSEWLQTPITALAAQKSCMQQKYELHARFRLRAVPPCFLTPCFCSSFFFFSLLSLRTCTQECCAC